MHRLRWYDYLTLNSFWLGLNIRNTAVSSIFMPYLVAGFVSGEVLNTALGAMRTAGLVIAMLVQPAMGLLSDRSTSRFGRRRPFIAVGVLFDLLFLAAIGLAGNYWLLLGAILLFQFSSNVSHGPLQGLIPDLVPPDQRGRASAVKAILELLPLILLAFTVAKLVEAGQVGWALAATGAGLFATMLITVLFVKEQPLSRTDPAWTAAAAAGLREPLLRVLGILAGIGVGAAAGLAAGALIGGTAGLLAWLLADGAAARGVGIGIGGGVAMVVAVIVGVWAGAMAALGRRTAQQQSPFTWWIVNRLLFLAAATSLQGFAPYFFMYAFKISRETAAGMTGNLMLAVGICTLLSALPGGWLADKLHVSHRLLVGLSGLVAAASALLLLATIWAPHLTLIYIAGCTLGLAVGLFMTANWALGAGLAPGEEAGRYLGISNLAGAGAGMIGAGIGGPMADLLNAVTPGLGYFAIFAWYGVLFVLSTVSLRWVTTRRRPVPA